MCKCSMSYSNLHSDIFVLSLVLSCLFSRPDLADQHKVGFFGQDRSSQTDLTEIVDLKEMTEVLQILLQVKCVMSASRIRVIRYYFHHQ